MAVESHRHGEKYGTAAAWTTANPVLDAGERGVESDTGRSKVGDGSTVWNSLAYAHPRLSAGRMVEAELPAYLASDSVALAADIVLQDRVPLNVLDFGAVGDGTETLLSAEYGSLGAAQADYPQATSLSQTLDWAAITKALATGPRVEIPDGEFVINCPLVIPTKRELRGWGKDTILRNNYSTFSVRGHVLYTGLFIMQHWQHGSGAMTEDALSAAPKGATEVTRTTTDLTIAAGDIVMVYGEAGLAGAVPGDGVMNRVTEVDGNDIALQYPIAKELTGPYHITKGDGGVTTGYEFGDLDSYFAENIRVSNMTLASDSIGWSDRAAVLEGVFEDLFIAESHNLIYGNGYAKCRFSRIDGVYRREAIEFAQGSWGNVLEDISGSLAATPDGGASALPIARLGVGATLNRFSFSDQLQRPNVFRLYEDCIVSNGSVDFYGGTTRLASESSTGCSGSRMENVDLTWTNASTAAALVVLGETETTDAFDMVGVVCNEPTSAEYTLLLVGDEGATRVNVDRAHAPNGLVDVNTAATLDDFHIGGSVLRDIIPTRWTTKAASFYGSGNRFSLREELVALRNDPQGQSTITATSETVLKTWTLVADQELRPFHVLRYEGSVSCSGSGGTKRFKIQVGGHTVGDLTIPTGAGLFAIEGRVFCEDNGNTIHQYETKLVQPAAVTFSGSRVTGSTIDLSAAATLVISAWKSSGGDVMTMRSFNFFADFPLT